MSKVQQKPFYPPFFTKYGQFTKGNSTRPVREPFALRPQSAACSHPLMPSPSSFRLLSALADTLTKKFEYKHKLSTIATSRNGLRIESGAIVQDSGSAVGYVKTRFPSIQYGTLTTELYTDASSESKADFAFRQLPAGLTLVTTASGKDKDKSFAGPVGGLEATYRQEYVATALKAKSDGAVHKVEAHASVGMSGISVGGVVAVDASNGADVTETNVGLEYEQDDYIASMYTEKNLSTATAAYFQRLTPSHVLAAQFSYNIKTRADRKLTVGSEYRIDADTTMKVKAELPSGDVHTHVEHRLANPRVLVGVASAFNLKAQTLSANKVGLNLTVGEF